MQRTQILEAVLFELNYGEDREAFLKNASITQTKVEQFAGYIKRHLFENDKGQWLDLVWWESLDEAMKAGERIMQDEACVPFMQAIKSESMKMYHLKSVDIGLSEILPPSEAKALEAVFFKPRPEVKYDDILETSLALQQLVESKTGYRHRQLSEADNQWLDLVWWESLELALKAAKEVESDASLAPQFSIFAGAEMTMLHFSPIRLEILAE
jgi:hypothetical protein